MTHLLITHIWKLTWPRENKTSAFAILVASVLMKYIKQVKCRGSLFPESRPRQPLFVAQHPARGRYLARSGSPGAPP